VHMADGTGVSNRDEHLVPGRGAQPCAALLEKLAADGYPGTVVLEVNTRRALSREAKMADLAESLEFTRKYLGRPAPAGEQRARVGEQRARAGGEHAQDNGEHAQASERRERGARPTGPDPVGPRGSVLPSCR
jgi:hypothetical protein